MANRPRNPCQVNSRWKKHSFFEADYQANIVVTMNNSTSYLFSINGIPRTVVGSFQGKFSNGTVANLPAGNYSFSWWTNEHVGGAVSMYFGNDWFSLIGGNPPLYLPQSIMDQYNTTIKTIQLPDRQYFQDVAPAAYDHRGPQFYVGAGIVSTVNITDAKCQTMIGGLNFIGVFPNNNDQWYYDARIVLDQNTIDKPIADGGGLLGTKCSNVAKNFMNRKYEIFCYHP
jgi:hypothetical protein